VAQRLVEVRGQLYKKAMRTRAAAQVQYDKAVQMCSYAVGDRVLIYHTPGETESGRELRVPWIGPYRITERHSAVFCRPDQCSLTRFVDNNSCWLVTSLPSLFYTISSHRDIFIYKC
jgi:hypothetical protein